MNPRRNEYLEQLPPTSDSWLHTFRLLVKEGASLHETVRGRHIAGLNISKTSGVCNVLEFLRLLAAKDVLQYDVVCGYGCWSALQNALRARSNTVDALELLNSAGVDLSKIMDDGRTALHLAAELCVDSEPLEYLYSHGCQRFINKQDQWGWTALHYATIARNSAVTLTPFLKVVSLVRNGANITLEASQNSQTFYDQPEKPFTSTELLKFARPTRFDMLLQVLSKAGIDVKFGINGEAYGGV
jgi:hypothetical protein